MMVLYHDHIQFVKFQLQDKNTLTRTSRDCNALESAYVKINDNCMLNWGGWGGTSIILSVKLYIKKLFKSFSSVFAVLVFMINKI